MHDEEARHSKRLASAPHSLAPQYHFSLRFPHYNASSQIMDVVSSVAAVVGLVFNFATAIKTCNDLRSRYKEAGRTFESIVAELETLQGALQELANLMMHDASALSSRWDTSKTLPGTFERALRGLKRTIAGLQGDMEGLCRGPVGKPHRVGRMEKVKMIWNDDAMKEHLMQLRAQSSALQLLLLVLQTYALTHSVLERSVAELTVHRGSISDVKTNLNSVEAALLQLSISSSGGEGRSEDLPTYRTSQSGDISHLLDREEDLLDLDWSVVSPQPVPGVEHSEPSGVDTIGMGSTGNQQDDQSDSGHTLDTSSTHESPPSLIQAVIKEDVYHVSALLDAGRDIEAGHPNNGRTAAIIAASMGYLEILEILLDRGANIDAKDKNLRTALHFAASEGYISCVELLLSRGASVDCVDFCVENPLHRAVRYGRTDVVRILISRFKDPLKPLARCERNILHIAAAYDATDIIKLICDHIRKGEHTRDCSDDPMTPLCAPACPVTYPGIDTQDLAQYTALEMALERNRSGVVSILLKLSARTARLLRKSRMDWLPVHYALLYADIEVARRYFNDTMDCFNTSLNDAATSGHMKNMMIAFGLKIICKVGSVEKVRLIFESSNSEDSFCDALRFAVSYGRSDITKYLMEKEYKRAGRAMGHYGKRHLTLVMRKASYKNVPDSTVFPGNSEEDFEACQKIVRAIIDTDREEEAGTDFVHKSESSQSRKRDATERSPELFRSRLK